MTNIAKIIANTFFIGAALGSVALSVPATAQTVSEDSPAVRTVDAKRYDLSTPAGVNKFTKATRLAIAQVCEAGLSNSAKDAAIINDCKAREMAKATSQIAQMSQRQAALALAGDREPQTIAPNHLAH